MASISYAVTCYNEIEELKRLISVIEPFLRTEDEIIVQADTPKVTKEVKEYLDQINVEFETKKLQFHRIYHTLRNDFAQFKNNIKEHCSKDWVFFLDADEYPTEVLVKNLSAMLDLNRDVDIVLVPRINTVENLTPEHISKWGWRLDEKGYVNWPDYQMRLCKNKKEIKWENKVHEKMVGFTSLSHLPYENDFWALVHPKTIERQEKQNNYYETI